MWLMGMEFRSSCKQFTDWAIYLVPYICFYRVHRPLTIGYWPLPLSGNYFENCIYTLNIRVSSLANEYQLIEIHPMFLWHWIFRVGLFSKIGGKLLSGGRCRLWEVSELLTQRCMCCQIDGRAYVPRGFSCHDYFCCFFLWALKWWIHPLR